MENLTLTELKFIAREEQLVGWSKLNKKEMNFIDKSVN
jgi:hypothetical protein